MSGDVTVLLAFAAGLVSFVSPCVLPLIPSYLSMLGAWVARGPGEGRTGSGRNDGAGSPVREAPGTGWGIRAQSLVITLGFVLGFSGVFVLLGLGAGLASGPVAGPLLSLGAGMVVIAMGLHYAFGFFRGLYREFRPGMSFRRSRVPGKGNQDAGAAVQNPGRAAGRFFMAIPMGAAFGAGWTPCIGPMLASILVVAGSSGDWQQGLVLLSFYSLGLGLPFLLFAAGAGTPGLSGLIAGLRRRLGGIQRVSGMVLIALGVLIATGRFALLTGWIVGAGLELGRWAEQHPGAAGVVGALVWLGLGGWLLWAGGRVAGPRKLPRRRRAVLMAALGLAFAVPGILNLLGIISVLEWTAAWLQFQGL